MFIAFDEEYSLSLIGLELLVQHFISCLLNKIKIEEGIVERLHIADFKDPCPIPLPIPYLELAKRLGSQTDVRTDKLRI